MPALHPGADRRRLNRHCRCDQCSFDRLFNLVVESVPWRRVRHGTAAATRIERDPTRAVRRKAAHLYVDPIGAVDALDGRADRINDRISTVSGIKANRGKVVITQGDRGVKSKVRHAGIVTQPG